ncbi:hypothetical protein GOODEAATRI_009658 [Goodea atripinnis]|uniref:Uncharacterized protein n=1 Tax=Goodea atripinnis TaxID=208336 RepID=A0ABV0MQR9_9TELE
MLYTYFLKAVLCPSNFSDEQPLTLQNQLNISVRSSICWSRYGVYFHPVRFWISEILSPFFLTCRFQLGSSCIRSMIVGTTGQFSFPEELTEVQQFFESIKEQASQLRATQIALDNLQKNIRWVQRNLETLRNWLNEQMK